MSFKTGSKFCDALNTERQDASLYHVVLVAQPFVCSPQKDTGMTTEDCRGKKQILWSLHLCTLDTWTLGYSI